MFDILFSLDRAARLLQVIDVPEEFREQLTTIHDLVCTCAKETSNLIDNLKNRK